MSRRAWTKEEICYIKREWGARSVSCIAEHLGRCRSSVWNKAYALGLPDLDSHLSRNREKWTDEEIYYLQDFWGTYTVPGIAEKLGRTVSAVRNKAHKLGLSRPADHCEHITLIELYLVTHGQNLSGNYAEFFHRNGLPIIEKRFGGTRKVRFVSIDAFWKWAETHKDKVKFSRIEKNILGKEPEWVDAQREMEKSKPGNRKYHSRWSEYELVRVKTRYLQGWTYGQIAEELDRSPVAVGHKVSKLGYQRIKRNLNQRKKGIIKHGSEEENRRSN